MLLRNARGLLDIALDRFPVVALLGSRQTGKTTLAKEAVRRRTPKAVYLDLELPGDAAKLADAQAYLTRLEDRLVVLDEVQRAPEVFAVLRALVDRSRRPGRFLVLGSASSALLRQASESLAGRIAFIELPPFLLGEVARSATAAARAWRKLWVRGGYPESFNAHTEAASLAWRRSFLRTFLERDVPAFGLRVTATQLRRFWTMLGHVHGQLWNAHGFAQTFGVSAPTVRSYLDVLTDLFVVRQLQPFAANVSKRLVKAPKAYVRDSGLLHALLDVEDDDALHERPALGASFEGFVVEQTLNALPPHTEAAFYRTHTGVELDLVLKIGGRTIGAEIKHTSTPTLTKGLRTALEDVGAARGYVVTAGDERFPLSPDVEAIPIVEFLRTVAAGTL